MYCRSLLMICRQSRTTSAIASRCLIPCYNNKLPSPFLQYSCSLSQDASNQPNDSDAPPSSTRLTVMQRLKRFVAIAPPIERFLLRSRIVEDEDLVRLLSRTAAITIYTFLGVTALGTFGVDTKPLLTGIGITGFTIGFALREVATNFISGIFLVIKKPFSRGCRIKIHGSGGGIEGIVHRIDTRYVHLKTKEGGTVMVPSAIIYTNSFTVFPVKDEDNVGFLDMTKPLANDTTKPPEALPQPTSKLPVGNDKQSKAQSDSEPDGSSKKINNS